MSPLRLLKVLGYEGSFNDILFQPAANSGARGREALVFFGGDVQDYPEIMEAHRDNRKYLKWNLENTARMLGYNFPNKHILVVRPSRIEYKSFSCYDNFVPSNNTGVPDHVASQRAMRHLHQLLQNVTIRLKAMPASELLEAISSAAPEEGESQMAPPVHGPPNDDPLWWVGSLALHEGLLSLVGFSKGCVVLNQLVHEFHYTTTTTTTTDNRHFTSLVRELYWLDGGHSGGGGAWLTERPLIHTLAGLGANIYVHVSPYQVEDESRPWIGREEKIFTSSLKKLGAKVLRCRHSVPGPPSLRTHFAVLENFKRLQDSALDNHKRSPTDKYEPKTVILR